MGTFNPKWTPPDLDEMPVAAPGHGSGQMLDAALGSAADVKSEVCEDIKHRQRLGIAKYGTTVAANPLSQREWLTHAYEEVLDLAVYLRRIIDGTQPPNGRGVRLR